MTTATSTTATRRSVAGDRLESRARRHFRLRKKVRGTGSRPRLVVSRSSRHLYAQIVDDARGVTLVSASTYKLDADGDKTARARRAGEVLAERAREAGVTAVVFDRGGNSYHGRIAALADAARAGGLEF